MDINFLKKIGFSDKSAQIYLALLRLGPSSVRTLAQYCGLNRGTTYDTLKWLQEEGVASFYNKDTKQHFVAESPEKLHELVKREGERLKEVDKEIDRVIPELSALYHSGGERPVARYYEHSDIRQILEDVLDVCEQTDEKMYRIYSTEGIRQQLYSDFLAFSDVRVAKGIAVRVVAIGEGGELRGLDERKWLYKESTHVNNKQSKPTSIIIYPGKTAYISLNAKEEPVGVVIENDGVYETQREIFDRLWNRL